MLIHLEALLLEVPGKFVEAGGNYHEIGIQRVYRLHIAIDGQAADQAIGSERFAGFD
jgi:hypothetical protein